ncbi:MAG TPA: cell division protein ZapD [Rhodocyclaceae bacterium]|nr:cell division protein ZapD [Betaproteobacteria bacterium]HMU99883.1 cell division protein ZapD [Rhodocyclaceae bacterium]HMV22167.1 cell division protein ZapD [Rhodocyclaceae bacterium]HNE43513.1 cell division protein ZapD [Rhodocyclaceae bacterium]HNL22723.1 cell division protein ZapD [Rhodocyclaceae bacterium]
MITYEYPFNERIRTLLRLEDLFDKTLYFAQSEGLQEHHVALVTLFEILEVAGRADLKMDLIQELERQRQTLLAYRNNPDISEEALSGALYEIEQSSAALLAMTGKIGQYLRENEWLMGIKSRAAIPGGVCEFDLPSYHWWLHRSPDQRRDAIGTWTNPLLPLRDALVIVLRLLRSSGRPKHYVASAGQFQLNLGGSAAQMVRITVPSTDTAVPEVSANKYALNVRFTNPPSVEFKTKICDRDVEFELTFCNL